MDGYVFISYSRVDWAARHVIGEALLDAGIKVWTDVDNLVVGEEWAPQIDEAIKGAVCVVLLVSPEAYTSSAVRNELDAAQRYDKPVVPVIVRGGEEYVPFELDSVQRVNLIKDDSNSGAMVKHKVVELVEKIKKRVEEAPHRNVPPPITATPHLKSRDSSKKQVLPFHYLTLEFLLKELKAAARLVDRDNGRASLLWFEGEETYVAAATYGYEEIELRMRLAKGKGIAGNFRQQPQKTRSSFYFLSEYANKDGQTKLGLSEQEFKLLQRMEFIICTPILYNSTMVGILCVDVLKQAERSDTSRPITENQLEDNGVLERLLGIAMNISDRIGKIDFYPIPYFKYIGFRNLIRTARLIPDYAVPVRAGMFWWNSEEEHLYMVGQSQRYSRDWKPGTVGWKASEGIIGAVKTLGRFIAEGREPHDDEFLYEEGSIRGMNGFQWHTVRDIRSIAGAPIISINDGEKEDVIGVLVLMSTYPMPVSKLDKPRESTLLVDLANIAANIYMTDPRKIMEDLKLPSRL